MSARGLYNAVVAALTSSGTFTGRVYQENHQNLSMGGANAVVREFEGRYYPVEIGSLGADANETGDFRVPVDVYIPQDMTITEFHTAIDAALTALAPSALAGNLRPAPSITKEALNTSMPACDAVGFKRVRLVVAATEYS